MTSIDKVKQDTKSVKKEKRPQRNYKQTLIARKKAIRLYQLRSHKRVSAVAAANKHSTEEGVVVAAFKKLHILREFNYYLYNRGCSARRPFNKTLKLIPRSPKISAKYPGASHILRLRRQLKRASLVSVSRYRRHLLQPSPLPRKAAPASKIRRSARAERRPAKKGAR